MRSPAVFLSVLSSLTALSAGISLDFCTRDLLPASAAATGLTFTKELNSWEFAVDSEFKSLHCCAKGYLSIEWFKDGRPYPWPSDLSSFILYPEAANQTVYTKVLSVSDAGNYTCRIHNDTSDMSHTMQLKVFDSGGYMENPLATYKPPNVSYANPGQSTRLFCEAFVGRIDLPDANNEVMWVKEGSALQSPHAAVEITSRDRGQIVGAYLTIQDIDESDFGSYSCFISNTGDQQIIMTTQLRAFEADDDDLCIYDKAMLLLLVFLAVVCLSLLVFSKQTRADVPVRLFFRKVVEISHNLRKGPPAGVIVLYGDEDKTFVDQKLLPALRRQYSYCPFPIQVSKQWGVSEESRELCKRVGRVVIVLSNKVTSSWTKEDINEALKQMMTMEAQYCVVLIQPLPYTLDEGNQLFHGLRTFSLIPWNDEAFAGGQVIFGCDRPATTNHSISTSQRHRTISRFFPVNLTSAEVQV